MPALLLLAALCWLGMPALGQAQADEHWDVVVVGSEPEAIAAAVAAAEQGAATLLLSPASRVGGLFVEGALTMLDLRVTPVDFQRGLFERWWRLVGRHNGFDVQRAEAAFTALLRDAGVTVRLAQPQPRPWMEGSRVVGVQVGDRLIQATTVVDGTADADFAAAAGARSTIGFTSLGHQARMVDTLMFRVEGVDWAALRRGAASRGGRGYAYVDDAVAYGHFGGYPAAYRSSAQGLRLRGLNVARQDDGAVWINALLIYGIDPFDPQSLAEGHARAAAEVPGVVAYLAAEVPGFANARPAGVAETLYVRETRHLSAHCQLSVDDVLNHVVTEQDVAAGGYPMDVQTLTPGDDGFVFGLPQIYGARLCMTVPQGVDGLWVVGKAAGFDPIAHASARVVPFGMALAEAVGVAAALAVGLGLSPAELAADTRAIAQVRAVLASRGAYLPPVQPRTAAGPVQHPHYLDFRTLLRWGLAVGGYDNDPRLDGEVSPAGLTYLLANLAGRPFGRPELVSPLIAELGLGSGGLSPEAAAAALGRFIDALALAPGSGWAGDTATWSELVGIGLGFGDPGRTLRRGEMYALASFALSLGDLSRVDANAAR